MEALTRPKDDLFDNSTMTFGEHLEELRGSLVKAIIWLLIGLAVGLMFANRVVRFIQEPLKQAIIEYNADRDLKEMGLPDRKEDPQVSRFYEFLTANSLVADVVYTLPSASIPLLTEDPVVESNAATESTSETEKDEEAGPDDKSEDGEAEALVVPARITTAELMKSMGAIPNPDELVPAIHLRRSERGLSSLKIEEPFMIWVKAGLIVGAVLASPMIFYHLWSFVAAGLHSHERRYVYVYLPFSVVLFVSGVVLAFGLVLHYVLTFLLQFNGSMDVAVEPRLTYYVNFVLMLPLGFGVAFQLPLVMLFLQRIDLIQTQDYINSWRVAVLVIFVISMIVTPADVTSMVALAVPLLFLYFLGIVMCAYMPRGRGLGSEAYDPA
ncbi:twin-arginine translocase subunit TatC [Rhodopirellula europaea]|uniref:Sec-independent protein translocase protein TatC n=1 Tax=Rhodopirellula europaea 6C TaxID=1263867 RepID=M2A3K9_9BACT|nr:twin-arginine translocase subunit TatC [Rhodopirellula europaea]EMB13716.1 Sec-independent protein translocase, TatC subunit [Rhodopirellula europaea 6C]